MKRYFYVCFTCRGVEASGDPKLQCFPQILAKRSDYFSRESRRVLDCFEALGGIMNPRPKPQICSADSLCLCPVHPLESPGRHGSETRPEI